MAQNATTVIEQPKTGQIAIVWNGAFAAVQFNCSCLDALKFCHGMCCRWRSGYTVELTEEEAEHYAWIRHPTRPDTKVLAPKKETMSCVYLDDASGKCTIHSIRPKMCRQWHCSPGGEKLDREIEKRDAGWYLMPVRKEEAEFLQLKRERNK